MKRPTAQSIEHAASTTLPSLLGAGVFAVAFVHVHDVARWAGQPEWASWLIATTGELMAIAAIVEIRARRRTGGSLFWPVLVMVASIVFSGACNLTAAYGLKSDPGHWTPVMALWPVIAFALVAGLKATRSASVPVSLPVTVPVVEVAPVSELVSEPSVLVDEVAPVAAPIPAPVAVDVVEDAPLTAPEPVRKTRPATAKRTTPKTSTARGSKPRTSKKLALTAYLDGVQPDDTRTDAELIRTYAPLVGLHENTARRYLASWRASRAEAEDAPVAVLPADAAGTAHQPVAA